MTHGGDAMTMSRWIAHRGTCPVIPCRKRHDGAWVAGALVLLLGLLAWANRADLGPTGAAAADDAAAWEAGRQVGRTEMAEVVGDAYLQGRADALGLRLADVPRQPPAALCDAPTPDRSLRRGALRDALCGGGL